MVMHRKTRKWLIYLVVHSVYNKKIAKQQKLYDRNNNEEQLTYWRMLHT